MDYVEYTMNIHFKYNRSQQFFLYAIHHYMYIFVSYLMEM